MIALNYNECKQKIYHFLQKENYQPLIIDIPSSEILSQIINDYCVGEISKIAVTDYCAHDEFPRLEDILWDIQNKTGRYFVTGLTSFLKLQGEEYLRKKLIEVINMSTKGHAVILTYQCRQYLQTRDPRLERRIILLEGTEDIIPELVFCSSNLSIPNGLKTINGLEKLAFAIEKGMNFEKLYVKTKKHKKQFPYSLYKIVELNDAYDALILKDSESSRLNRTWGTEQQWEYALKLFDKAMNWADVIDREIGDHSKLEIYVPGISQMSHNQLWLYYIGIKLYSIKNNDCLYDAVMNSSSVEELNKFVYRGILNKAPSDDHFWEYYDCRKKLLKFLNNSQSELNMYCKLIVAKKQQEIYFLTDNTEREKEEIFTYLDKYGRNFSLDELKSILLHVYPDLAAYLIPYDFKNKLLNDYFDQYKYQKVINKLFPDFNELVLEQAQKREYNSILAPRASQTEKLAKPTSLLYFMDAMGVEYLGYIKTICNELRLKLNVSVCRAEIPSITSLNKEFLEGWQPNQVISIKEIDDIKHRGKYNYDYYRNSKLPIHLIKELEVIRDVLEKIKLKLVGNENDEKNIDEVVMISDHGASRLVVLHDKENIWEMAEKGRHFGRCCKKSEIDEQPKYAADAGEYWALANYDRFKGSRKASVEVHGGATLEEICVPIIRISYTNKNIEVYIMPLESSMDTISQVPEIEVSYRKKAVIKIFMTDEQDDVSVVINNKRYPAIVIGQGYYRVDLPDIKKKGTYEVDVYSGNNLLAEKLQLNVRREGMREKDLL